MQRDHFFFSLSRYVFAASDCGMSGPFPLPLPAIGPHRISYYTPVVMLIAQNHYSERRNDDWHLICFRPVLGKPKFSARSQRENPTVRGAPEKPCALPVFAVHRNSPAPRPCAALFSRLVLLVKLI